MKHIVQLSGGKDSTAMLIRLIEISAGHRPSAAAERTSTWQQQKQQRRTRRT